MLRKVRPARSGSIEGDMYQHLLVPIDGSALSQRAVSDSIALARKLGARITGFVAEPFVSAASDGVSSYSAASLVSEHAVAAHALGVLERFEAQAQAAGVPFEGHVAHNADIGEAIAGAARRYGCDLIVMATHGRGPLGELLWGSHTKSVLAHTKLPLLVLH